MYQWRESTEIIARRAAADDELKLETATTLDEIAALRVCYDALLAVTGNTLPFALHEWHLAWCRHFLNCNPAIADEPLFCVLRTASGLCVAIVPLVISRRRVGPLRHLACPASIQLVVVHFDRPDRAHFSAFAESRPERFADEARPSEPATPSTKRLQHSSSFCTTLRVRIRANLS